MHGHLYLYKSIYTTLGIRENICVYPSSRCRIIYSEKLLLCFPASDIEKHPLVTECRRLEARTTNIYCIVDIFCEV